MKFMNMDIPLRIRTRKESNDMIFTKKNKVIFINLSHTKKTLEDRFRKPKERRFCFSFNTREAFLAQISKCLEFRKFLFFEHQRFLVQIMLHLTFSKDTCEELSSNCEWGDSVQNSH